jgi:putative FmdB family regulatory protein
MPLYEYRCEEDGETITLLRQRADADRPVEDPKGRGRTFERVHSTFAVGSGKVPPPSPGCACGNPDGPCHL